MSRKTLDDDRVLIAEYERTIEAFRERSESLRAQIADERCLETRRKLRRKLADYECVICDLIRSANELRNYITAREARAWH